MGWPTKLNRESPVLKKILTLLRNNTLPFSITVYDDNNKPSESKAEYQRGYMYNAFSLLQREENAAAKKERRTRIMFNQPSICRKGAVLTFKKKNPSSNIKYKKGLT